MSVEAILAALASKTGFEAVNNTSSVTSLRLLGRAPQTRMPDMLALFTHLHVAMRQSPWVVDTSKLYFTPEDSNQTFCAWRFIFEATEGSFLQTAAIASVISQLRSATNISGQGPLEEIRLPGAGNNRNQHNARGKGAAPLGQGPSGPQRGY